MRELIRGHHSGDGCGTWAPSWALWRRLWNVGAVVGTLETAVVRGRRRGRTEEALDELRVEGKHATKLGDCISAISG